MDKKERDSLLHALDLAAHLQDSLEAMKNGFVEDAYDSNQEFIPDKFKCVETLFTVAHRGAHAAIAHAEQFFQDFSEQVWVNQMLTTLMLLEASRMCADHIQRRAADLLMAGGGSELPEN